MTAIVTGRTESRNSFEVKEEEFFNYDESEENIEDVEEGDTISRITGNFKCLICGKSYKKEISLYAHITSHSEDILGGKSNSELNLAYTIEKEIKTSTYTCKSCNFSTPSLKTIQMHIKNHPGSLGGSYTNKENQSPEVYSNLHNISFNISINETLEGKYKCKDCDECFVSQKDFECHQKDHQERPFQCNTCCKKYKDKHGLKWHIKTHHEPSRLKYKCEICDKVYPMNSRLQQHKATSHSDNTKEDCDICGKSFSKFYLPSHRKTHSQVKDYRCKHCDRSFQRKEYLKAHMAVHSTDKPFECDTCKKCFPSKKYLLFHLKTHFVGPRRKKGRPRKGAETTDSKDDESIIDSQTLPVDETVKRLPKKKRIRHEKPFKCDEENCQYSTSQYALLKAHKFKHNPFYKCITCQEKFPTRLDLKNHMSSHGERPYKCDQCNKCYKDKHGLGWHKKVQHDPSRLKFTCELCGKTYPFDSLLTQHINLTHATEKQSVCDICGKNVSKTYLPMHRRTHGEKQFSCDICEKTFLEKAYLKRHKMVHTGEKPYVCSVCGNSFRQHSTLTIHMRTHTGDRPYKCILCENAYKTHHNLKKHYKRSGHKLV